MDRILENAFRQGYERMAAWSGLLDEINLFPVADADTGRNLRISLAPLKQAAHRKTAKQLLLSATGNSGNIAGAFFSKFIQVESCKGLPKAVAAGRHAAWRALLDPKAGTMLSVFDALDAALRTSLGTDISQCFENIVNDLKQAVLQTSQLLPELRSAEVVDSGALGMFLFFEGFFHSVAKRPDPFYSPHRNFGTNVIISNKSRLIDNNTYCIDSIVVPAMNIKEATQKIGGFGRHVVAHSDGRHLKIHLHADDAETARQRLASVGDVIQWRSEKIVNSQSAPWETLHGAGAVHVVTDAAGSLFAEEARELGVTLLDSYILIGDMHLPETAVSAETLYSAMKRGVKVTTAQASTFERHQQYEYLTQRYNQIIYLSVGSAYTGNYEVARRWVAEDEGGRRMTVIDTGAASGRLGLIARSVAQYANLGRDGSDIARFAQDVSRRCNEFVFLDQLKYLAAGGRISKANGFMGDMLKIKPVIRPGSDGAQKVGVVRNRRDQVQFAIDHLGASLDYARPVEILLQYTDNQDWVTADVQPRIQALLPLARIQTRPMSLTAGVHMGPGTWAVAYLPFIADSYKHDRGGPG
jgi:fatty acid kinase/fatty acid kinase fatty acid binding subunit